MEYNFDKTTNIEEIFDNFDNKTQNIITISDDTDFETIKSLLNRISSLPDSGFKFFNVRFKELSSEKKVEILKYSIKEQLCIINLIETIVLLINSSNNYNTEFFANKDVFFSSIVDYLDICDELEEEIKNIKQQVIYYFFAITKSYINHPRFIINETSNYEAMPKMYEYIMMLLDFFNLSFIMNTPEIELPDFSKIPNNLKSETNFIDLWSDKQKFVVSTLSELAKVITEKLNNDAKKEE